MNISTAIFRRLFVISCLAILGCNGESKTDQEIDRELCEAQDGKPVVYYWENRETGEFGLEIRCEFEKDYKIQWCKPDNGFGGEC